MNDKNIDEIGGNIKLFLEIMFKTLIHGEIMF